MLFDQHLAATGLRHALVRLWPVDRKLGRRSLNRHQSLMLLDGGDLALLRPVAFSLDAKCSSSVAEDSV